LVLIAPPLARSATDMILPCRIHRTCRLIDSLPLAFLFAAFLLVPRNEAIAQYAAGSSGGQKVPLDITAGVSFGYDDHVIGSNATTSSGQTSFLARENVVLAYDRPGDRTELRLLAVGRFTQFFDLGTDDKDANVTFSLAHNLSTRLSLRADIYAAYQTEPDFASNVGPENVRSPHFSTNDTFSLTYQWRPRLAMITTYNFQRVKYEESSQEAQNRMGNTLSEQFLFSLTRRTTLIGNYRFEIIDYDTAPRDSITHYALAGIAHSLTQHLSINLLGGELFRSFKDDGDTIDPYAVGKLTYEGSNHSLSWIVSYRVEEPSAQQALFRTTIRTGVTLTYDLTSRITGTMGVDYHHDVNEGSTSSGGFNTVGSQDTFHLALGLRYRINKHFLMNLTYERTMESSLGTQAGFSRSQYFAGLTYTY
jgi:Putative beta-barrel porin 2